MKTAFKFMIADVNYTDTSFYSYESRFTSQSHI